MELADKVSFLTMAVTVDVRLCSQFQFFAIQKRCMGIDLHPPPPNCSYTPDDVSILLGFLLQTTLCLLHKL